MGRENTDATDATDAYAYEKWKPYKSRIGSYTYPAQDRNMSPMVGD